MLGFVPPLPQQSQHPTASGHMVVCGDDTLARRLAVELRYVYGERVTLVLPPGRDTGRPDLPLTQRARAAALFGRMSAAMNRNGAVAGSPDDTNAGVEAVRIMEAHEPSDEVLEEAGVDRAAALALVYDDDERNIRAALTARRLNPRLRLVIRLYNRKLGQHLETLLDQAAAVAMPGLDPAALDASTTVLSDADTAAPALAATAVTGSSKVIQAEGLLLRAAERTPPRQGELADPGLCTLALLSSTTHDPAGTEGSDSSGDEGPQLLPDRATVAAATGRGTVVLEAISQAGPDRTPTRMGGRGAPLGHIFSRRLRWSALGVAAAVVALAVASVVTTGDSPVHAAYLTLLDLLAMGDPAEDTEPASRRIIQLLSGTAGLLLLPCSWPPSWRPSVRCAPRPRCAARPGGCPAMWCSWASARSVRGCWCGCARWTSPWSSSRRTRRPAVSRWPAACTYRRSSETSPRKVSWRPPRSAGPTPCSP